MNKTVIDVKNIQKIYGSKEENRFLALDDISFTVTEGEFVGIMGPSGSGKTTLLNAISTLDQVDSGSVSVAGIDITKKRQNALADFRAQQLGFIFQDFNLLDNLTVHDNIALPLSLQNRPYREITSKVQKVAQMLDIAEILQKYSGQISGGQKQRVAAARAIIHEPALLLGDEPTGSLDSKNARSLLEAMRELNECEGISIMMVTHDAFSASYCQRILFIQDGKLRKEIFRSSTREAFYKQILAALAEADAVKF